MPMAAITVESTVVRFNNITADSIVANASITAPSIYGGTFYNADGDAYLTVGDDLNFYGSATTGAPLFTVFDDIGTMDLKAYNNTFLSYSSTASQAFTSGNWKFYGQIILTSGVHYGTLAQRPAAGTAGRIFFVRS